MGRRDGCAGKRKHQTKIGAIIALKRLKNVALQPYQCRLCGAWHLGHTREQDKLSDRIGQVLKRYEQTHQKAAGELS